MRNHAYGYQTKETSLDRILALIYNSRAPLNIKSSDTIILDTLLLSLRPSEKFIFNWSQAPGPYYQYYNSLLRRCKPLLRQLRLGSKCSLLLLRRHCLLYSDTANIVIRQNGNGYSIRTSHDTTKSAKFSIVINNPYGVVKGNVNLWEQKTRPSSSLSVYFHKSNWSSTNFEKVYAFPLSTGTILDSLDFTNNIQAIGHAATNAYCLRFLIGAGSSSGIFIDSLKIVNLFQLNPALLPRLYLGGDTRSYWERGRLFVGRTESHAAVHRIEQLQHTARDLISSCRSGERRNCKWDVISVPMEFAAGNPAISDRFVPYSGQRTAGFSFSGVHDIRQTHIPGGRPA